MELIGSPPLMQARSHDLIREGRTIGFVPTMGALHEGHVSLMERMIRENDISVVSIFVNPAQFGPGEDFERYPRDMDNDREKLERIGVSILFSPEPPHIYPEGYMTFIDVEGLSTSLCGHFRPGHFRGVATIVTKLFNIVKPARAYFGQKDYQQSMVIRQMVRDLNMDTEVIVCPTFREEDGLAMSSRNAYLNTSERKDAGLIYQGMKVVEDELRGGEIDLSDVPQRLQNILVRGGSMTEIQYASVYDPEGLHEISDRSLQDYKGRSVLLAIAVKIGVTRLIDNLIIDL